MRSTRLREVTTRAWPRPRPRQDDVSFAAGVSLYYSRARTSRIAQRGPGALCFPSPTVVAFLRESGIVLAPATPMPRAHAASAANGRDVRIDLLRGLAMACVIVNHTRLTSVLSWFSYERFWV